MIVLDPAPKDVDLLTATRGALRRLVQSVSVITCRLDGVRSAMAATAVNALSMEPPSLLVCVNRSASIHAMLAGGERFAINILHRGQEALSHRCGGGARGEERFAGHVWDDVEGVPVLSDAQASILCRRDLVFDYGSHSIFVGRVEAVRTYGDVNPLLYVEGRYAGLG